MAREARGKRPKGATLNRAGGLCECVGDCGENHCYVPGAPPIRCRVCDHSRILRSKTHPSYWVRAPRAKQEIRCPEDFAPDVIEARLVAVPGPDGERAFCERCAQAMRRKKRARAPVEPKQGVP